MSAHTDDVGHPPGALPPDPDALGLIPPGAVNHALAEARLLLVIALLRLLEVDR